jgi:hypothetical protein
VDAGLGFKVTVGVWPLYQDGRILYARILSGEFVYPTDLVFPGLGPPRVHAQQHRDPVAGFRAAGACVHAQDGVGFVRILAQKALELDFPYLAFQGGKVRLEML